MLAAHVPYATPTSFAGVIDPTDQWYTGREAGHLPGTATVLLPPGVHGLGDVTPWGVTRGSGLLWGLIGAAGIALWTTTLFWAAGTKRKWTPGLIAGGGAAAIAMARYVWGD